jgi:hypothetical protein
LRRRRRRSSFAQDRPQGRFILIGLAAIALVGGFFFFLRQADVLAPETHEISAPLPDAFKE